MPPRFQDDSGFGLVELLIAMTVMSVAVFALVAGLGSGIEATKRASKASTAGTLADKRMEEYRRETYSAISTNDDVDGPPEVGPDGRSYLVTSSSTLSCIFGGTPDETVTPPTCPPDANGLANRPLRVVTVTVYDGATTAAPILIKQSSTFDQSTGT